MKVYVKRPVASKVAAALADHPDPDVQALARHLVSKVGQESRFLTADELESILAVLDAGLGMFRQTGTDLAGMANYRRTLAARPKLVSFLDSIRKREALGRDLDEDAD